MPNLIKNIVIIKGDKEQLAKVENICFNMDFDKIIPMPETLNVPSGRITYYALGAYIASIIGNDSTKWKPNDVSKYTNMIRLAQYEGLEKIIEYGEQYLLEYPICGEVDSEHPYGIENEDLSYMWLKTNDYIAKLPKNRADAFALGHILYMNIEKYKYPDWFWWCQNVWGTKQNSMDVHIDKKDDRISYTFKTIWDAPQGIMDYLAKKLFNLEIQWNYADENLGDNCALTIKRANSINYSIIDKEKLSIACEVWGYDIEEMKTKYGYKE